MDKEQRVRDVLDATLRVTGAILRGIDDGRLRIDQALFAFRLVERNAPKACDDPTFDLKLLGVQQELFV